MNRASILVVCAVAFGAAASVRAEQQVTLKSGVAMVGDVAFDGDALVVTISGAEHRVSLADVASVAPVGVGGNEQARQLLLASLESRVLGGSPREALGLIAAAARLAPDDPQIAFWYASTLVDAGQGNAANKVLQEHRAAIEAEFPERIEKLAKQINARMIMELLPEPLVARLDAFASGTAPQPANPEQRIDFVAFRVVDQFDAPVARAAIQINGNFNEQHVEEFPEGYFLVTLTRHRSQGNDPCQLQVGQYGLMTAQFELRPSSGQMFPAEEFVVHRYEDADKRTFRGLVVDRDGNPIAGARVVLQPAVNNDGVDRAQTAVAGEDGRVAFQVFPGPYSVTASAEGYSQAGAQTELPAEGQAPEQRLALHRAVAANIRIEWRGAVMQGFGNNPAFGGEISGETTFTFNGAQGMPYNQEIPWLRPNQVQDRLALQINLMMYGGMPLGGGGPWVKRRSGDGAGDDQQRLAAARQQFDAIDLEAVDDLPKEFKPLNAGNPNFGPGNLSTPADFGDVLVGRLISRDMRTGQPIDMTFKAIVEPAD